MPPPTGTAGIKGRTVRKPERSDLGDGGQKGAAPVENSLAVTRRKPELSHTTQLFRALVHVQETWKRACAQKCVQVRARRECLSAETTQVSTDR